MSKKYDYVNRYKNTVNYIVYDGRCDPDWNTELMISDCNDDLRCGSFQGFYELYRAIDYGRIIMVIHNEGTTLVCKETYETTTIVDRIDDSIVYADKLYRWYVNHINCCGSHSVYYCSVFNPLICIGHQEEHYCMQETAIDPITRLMRDKIIDRRLINYGTNLLRKNKARHVTNIDAFIDVCLLFDH